MVNNGGNDAAGQRALYKALERAAEAQRRLNEAISRASAGAGNIATSSSESEDEEAAVDGCQGTRRSPACDRQRRSKDGGCRMRSHPYRQCSRMGHHSANGPWDARSGFQPGRHMRGFPGFGAFPGMQSHGMGPHPHHHHQHHQHGHGHGHFGGGHAFGGRAGHCGRRGVPGNGFGTVMGPFGRVIHHFGMRHVGGHRRRANSFPGL